MLENSADKLLVPYKGGENKTGLLVARTHLHSLALPCPSLSSACALLPFLLPRSPWEARQRHCSEF